MKSLLKSSLLIMAITLSFISSSVNAKTVYYTNPNGVQMSRFEYEKIVDMTSELRVQTISQEEFDRYINADIIGNSTLYQKLITDIDGEIISIEYITKDEYENNLSTLICEDELQSSSNGFFETSYKRFNVDLLDYGNNFFEILGDVAWKQVPACRSFDVFAFRLQHMTYNNATAIQTYFVGNNYTNIYYNSSSPGFKSASNGVGYSMNLKDDTNITAFDMTLSSFLSINEFNYTQAHVFTTYQHAQSSLTRDQSKSYTLSAGGLGDVLYYSNTTIRNKYDDMSGIELTTPI